MCQQTCTTPLPPLSPPQTVSKWRKILDVPAYNQGSAPLASVLVPGAHPARDPRRSSAQGTLARGQSQDTLLPLLGACGGWVIFGLRFPRVLPRVHDTDNSL